MLSESDSGVPGQVLDRCVLSTVNIAVNQEDSYFLKILTAKCGKQRNKLKVT